MKKRFLFGLGILISVTAFATTMTIGTKSTGEGLTASEFNQIISVLEGIQNVSGRIGIGTVPIENVKLDVNGMIKVTPIATGGACDNTIEGSIYLNSSVNHWYGYNGTDWVQLDNE